MTPTRWLLLGNLGVVALMMWDLTRTTAKGKWKTCLLFVPWICAIICGFIMGGCE